MSSADFAAGWPSMAVSRRRRSAGGGSRIGADDEREQLGHARTHTGWERGRVERSSGAASPYPVVPSSPSSATIVASKPSATPPEHA